MRHDLRGFRFRSAKLKEMSFEKTNFTQELKRAEQLEREQKADQIEGSIAAQLLVTLKQCVLNKDELRIKNQHHKTFKNIMNLKVENNDTNY